MTRYEGYEANSPSPVNEHLCMGYHQMDINIHITDNPANPIFKNWSVTACNNTKTICYVGLPCSDGKKIVFNKNYSEIQGFGFSTEDPRRPGSGIPRGPLADPWGWPAIGSDGRGTGYFMKIYFLGCCSEGCKQNIKGPARVECHTANGIVNPNALPDPMEAYYGVSPGEDNYVKIDKVGAHAFFQALKMFGENGSRAKPRFDACCRDGGGAGAGATGGSSNA